MNPMLMQPWALESRAYRALRDWFDADTQVPFTELLASLGAKPPGPEAKAGRPLTARGGAVAVLPIQGPLAQRTMFSFFSDMTLGYADIAAAFDFAMADPQVGAIVLDVDSPGGSVFGLEELARKVFAARDAKPVVAVANSVMASAAYYLASQAREVVATPGSMVGSIGTIGEHVDASQFYANRGLKITEVTAGKYKGELSDAAPLSEEARAHLQSQVDHYYGMFVDAVARGRTTTAAKVKSDMGEGRMLTAQQAKAAGMVDRIATLEETIARLAGKPGGKAPGAKAEDVPPALVAATAETPAEPIAPASYDAEALRRRLELQGRG